MKMKFVFKICLGISLFLLVGVLLAQANGKGGFVSFEDGNKIIIWDPVKLTDRGFKMSPAGINDTEYIEDGRVIIRNKDVFIRNFLAFGCSDYPASSECATMVGNTGGDTFLEISKLKGSSLLLNSNAGFELNVGENSSGLKVVGKLFLNTDKNLVVTQAANLPEDPANPGSVYTDRMFTNEIVSLGTLEFPGLIFENPIAANVNSKGARLKPLRLIDLNFLPPSP